MDLSTVHQGVQKRKLKKRVGRGVGSGHGKTAGRGHKGQYSSAGAGHPHKSFEGGQMQLFRRVPKRGFSHSTWDRNYVILNLKTLDEAFEDGDVVDLEAAKSKGLIKGHRVEGIRVLGEGKLSKKLTVKAHHFSKSAKEKIEGKGGTTELLSPPKKPVRNKMGTRLAKAKKKTKE